MQKNNQYKLDTNNVLYKEAMLNPKSRDNVISSQAIVIADISINGVKTAEDYCRNKAYNLLDKLNLKTNETNIDTVFNTMKNLADSLKDDPKPECRRKKFISTAKKFLEDLLQKKPELDQESAPPAGTGPTFISMVTQQNASPSTGYKSIT
jgi:hypothetical protein